MFFLCYTLICVTRTIWKYFPMENPPPHWKIRQIDPPLPWKIWSLPWGWYGYFLEPHIAKFISIAVHKEIVLFIHKGYILDSYHLNFSCHIFAYMICSSYMYFIFFSRYAFISIYSFNNFSCANKKASSKQSTLCTSANRLIFYTPPVSFVGQTRSFMYLLFI